MRLPINILHVEDQPEDVELCRHWLESADLRAQARRVDTKAEFEDALAREAWDLILSDFTLPSFDGLSALQIARDLRPEIPFLFYSGTMGEEAAVEALRKGACDYVLKHRPLRLPVAVRRALEEAEERRSRREAEQALRASEQLAHRHLVEFECIYRQAPVGLCFMSRDLRCTQLNNRMAELAGRLLRDAIGRPFRELFPALAFKLEPVCRKALQLSKSLENIEIRGPVCATGDTERSWLVSMRPHKNAAGLISGLNTVLAEKPRPAPKA